MKVKFRFNLRQLTLLFVVFLGFFILNFRLDSSPLGITADEGAIGYNAILLGRNLKDETGRFLPVFTLTVNGTDWKQPITQYTTALAFKILPPSVNSLRMVSVFAAVIGLILLIYLSNQLLGFAGSLISALIYIITPAVVIHSHLGQENIMPIPFTLIWLLGLYLHGLNRSRKPLIAAGLALGLSFYSYKGMRLIVPVWIIISIAYLFLINLESIRKYKFRSLLTSLFTYSLCIFPFLAISPWLNQHYANAIFDSTATARGSVYDLIYPYLTSFDPSHLFIKGDITPWHSTNIHGFFLLSTAPIFMYGLYQAAKKRGYWWFVIAVFFATPALYGLANSAYRYSRLLALVPSYVLLFSLGFHTLLSLKPKKLSFVICSLSTILIIWNGVDFLNYYLYTYPQVTRSDFMVNYSSALRDLQKLSLKHHLTPYVEQGIVASGENYHFFSAINFVEPPKVWTAGEKLPSNGILLTKLREQPELISKETSYPEYYLMVNATDSNSLKSNEDQ